VVLGIKKGFPEKGGRNFMTEKKQKVPRQKPQQEWIPKRVQENLASRQILKKTAEK